MDLPARVPTGIPGLDGVLGGGLTECGLYLVEGAAGAGKTILGAQIGFNRAREGGKVLFVSLLSESHGKLLQHLSGLSFFDEALLGSRFTLLSGYDPLARGGPDGLLQFITASARELRPALLVVDGFRSVRSLAASEAALARFTHELNSLGTAVRCVTLLLAPLEGNMMRPEHTLVDGLLELGRYTSGMRVARELQVHKLRGADPLLGKHIFSITREGLAVIPRLESLGTRDPGEPAASSERLKFGIAQLDAMLHGGLVGGGTTAVLGAPGAGKTLLSLKFLEEGLRLRQKALYFGFYESPARLLGKAEGIGLRLAGAARDGALRVLWQPPLEYVLDELGERLLGAVRATKARRVAIDGIEGFKQAAIRPERLSMFLTALGTGLRGLGAEAIFTEELPLRRFAAPQAPYLVSALIENVIELRYFESRARVHRLISIVKVRESDYDNTIREFRISPAGIEVEASSEGAAALHEQHPGR